MVIVRLFTRLYAENYLMFLCLTFIKILAHNKGNLV